ncbi:MAG: beta-galactosidase [Cyclobacteriaceae bacterium]
MINIIRISFFILFVSTLTICFGQSLDEIARAKIVELNGLIEQAKEASIDVRREEMAVHTADLCLGYAQWDEDNTSLNLTHYEAHPYYKDEAQKRAEELPDFQRQSVITVLDNSIHELTEVIAGNIVRTPVPVVDWTQVDVDGNKLVYNSKPVFFDSYIWIPSAPELEKYYGPHDSEGLRMVYINDDQGARESWTYNRWKEKTDGFIGSIWFDQNTVPAWAKEKYPDIQIGGRHYGKFDVDHQGSREMIRLLAKDYVPLLADREVTELGYSLWNEPSFFTKEGSWNNADDNGICVSDSTRARFKKWLSEQHDSIEDLNVLWGASFESFDEVEIKLPMPGANQGSPMWYDWMTFNNLRITNWFQFVKDEIRKYDTDAKVHIKLMPWLFGENAKDHGMDFEALTELSGIIGCDAGTQYLHSWKENQPWEQRYSVHWRNAFMTFDFFKSVSPEKIIFDTENHFLMNTGFTEQDLDQTYVRSMYWLGAMHGLNASTTWVWMREADGSVKRSPQASSMVDISHQPKTLYTVTSTFMDLNANSEVITQIQNQRKDIRVFYSKTSSLNDATYMDKVFATYESLYFEGIPIGFATENILKSNPSPDWDVILVRETEYVTQEELAALQAYVDAGGTVIVDSESLKKDQYGKSLSGLSGNLMSGGSLDDFQSKALQVVSDKGHSPNLAITETNDIGLKGCTWKTVTNESGNAILSLVNLGKTEAKLSINLKNAVNGTKLVDVFTGNEISSSPTLAPFEMIYVEILDEKVVLSNEELEKENKFINLFPNPSSGEFQIELDKIYEDVYIDVMSIDGKSFMHKYHKSTKNIKMNLTELRSGTYFIRVETEEESKVMKFLKH